MTNKPFYHLFCSFFLITTATEIQPEYVSIDFQGDLDIRLFKLLKTRILFAEVTDVEFFYVIHRLMSEMQDINDQGEPEHRE